MRLIGNGKYKVIRGSDLRRDGMYLELIEVNDDPSNALAEVFYSDITKEFVVSTFSKSVSMPILEELFACARNLLPRIPN